MSAIAIEAGPVPTEIGVPAALVAMSIGVTLSALRVTTYAVVPSGVIAIAKGYPGSEIGVPTVLVAVAIGTTVSALNLPT
jgi:hypothetical protein